jgi:hypothetical protein
LSEEQRPEPARLSFQGGQGFFRSRQIIGPGAGFQTPGGLKAGPGTDSWILLKNSLIFSGPVFKLNYTQDLQMF